MRWRLQQQPCAMFSAPLSTTLSTLVPPRSESNGRLNHCRVATELPYCDPNSSPAGAGLVLLSSRNSKPLKTSMLELLGLDRKRADPLHRSGSVAVGLGSIRTL